MHTESGPSFRLGRRDLEVITARIMAYDGSIQACLASMTRLAQA